MAVPVRWGQAAGINQEQEVSLTHTGQNVPPNPQHKGLGNAPSSSICDFPDFVEATTLAVAWLTSREAP